MDVLKHLQLSLADHYEQAFDEAQRNLAAEICTRDRKIRELEAQNKALQSSNTSERLRVQELEGQVKQLEDDIGSESRAANEEQQTVERLSTLRSTYDPKRLSRSIHDSYPENTDKKFDKSLEQLEGSYQALYDDVRTLLSVTDSLRIQVKRHKERAVQWQRWQCHNNKTQLNHELPNLPQSSAVVKSAGHNQVKTSSTKSQPDMLQAEKASLAQSDNTHYHEVDRELQRVKEHSSEINHSHTDPVQFKAEPLSSSPLPEVPPCQEMNGSETQDLDDVGHLVNTPRRQTLDEYEENSPDFQRVDSNYQNPQDKESHALQPRDANQVISDDKIQDFPSKRRRTNGRGVNTISRVSEDGNDFFSKPKSRREEKPSPQTRTRQPQTYLRLDALLQERPQAHRQSLDQRSSDSTAPCTSDASTRDRGTSNKPVNIGQPLNNELRSENEVGLETNGTRLTAENKFARGSKIDNERWKLVAQSVPYRERPVDFLDLNCFRLNPARNEGFNFAFKEVVRNRDQRICLPGCMRPDCCGNKFRAMVRAGGIKFEEKDQASLEHFLGDRKDTLDAMTDIERQQLLIEVKAKALADQFGRHRPAHDRPRSPPGFWRTDMPSTQELANDHREADRISRDKIIERVQEAMRPNGLWKFADEV
ncbi:DNA repair protein endonuclease SAE2/CtIP C-terminus-domain-containing protein [Talaromyces proteolyticus]|uniref:DNA repair protein endonuclease SAE2/CtIP C-terminus-domain-containing protein n=1 Tax=Talaromyces proteolyticus TaxID=1131652 RepID=A0AAD4KZ97_9EURO|nr:DNA repair protein endonuclease SAE2/CtIP C-terminus-domain-containing protein [Talaromyces proteolyticus]KAH8704276.1 DNA repair protein endonuclease SAE2/CtIP C-terminus-domain-containing protein [Talaromyces proteolyticus]